MVPSSNGRTAGFQPGNMGSTPVGTRVAGLIT